jgi:thymidine phosphorylase
MSADLIELTNILAGWMLYLGGQADTPEDGAARADRLLRDGSAYAAWLKIVEAQGGDTEIFDQPERFHRLAATRTLTAAGDGYLASIDTASVGWAVQRLGAGRVNPGGPVDPHAGIEVHAKLGERMSIGQPLVTVYAVSEELVAEPYEMLSRAYKLSSDSPELRGQVQEIIRARLLDSGWTKKRRRN